MPCSHHSCFYRSFDLHAALGSFLNHLHGSKEAKEETTFLFLFLFASGRLVVNQPPVLLNEGPYTDPLPQALALTAIVIAFGMTALVVIMALASFVRAGTDEVDMETETPVAHEAANDSPTGDAT